MRRALKLAASLSALTLLSLATAACQTPLDDPVSPAFGQAVASLDAQIAPAHYDPRPPESSGQAAVIAIRRLEHDAVKPPLTAYTSETSNQMGSGGAPAGPATGVSQ